MSRNSEMKKKIRSAFPNIHFYMEAVSIKHLCIQEYEIDNTAYLLKDIDIENRICTVDKIDHHGGLFSVASTSIPLDENKIFSIKNARTVCFIPIDGKNGLLGGISNCDFVFWNKKDFCFVELKLNATIIEDRPIRKNRKKAISQLKNTIDFFDSKLGKDYSDLNLQAYVATPDVYPRENTAWQSLKVEFLEEVGIDLFENRVKIY